MSADFSWLTPTLLTYLAACTVTVAVTFAVVARCMRGRAWW
jgi:hypothetical protein